MIRFRPLLSPAPLGFVALLALLLLTGCATSPNASSARGHEEPKLIDLRRGMNAAQVTELLGQPAEVQVPKDPGSAHIEVWVYRRNVGSRIDSVSPTLMTEPWVDPLTGILYYLERPNPSERRVDFIEELHLYFASGVLTEANRSVRRDYTFTSQ